MAERERRESRRVGAARSRLGRTDDDAAVVPTLESRRTLERTMIKETTGKQVGGVVHDETVAKVFVVVSDDTRRCLVCDQLFTRQGSREHSMTICYPLSSAAN